MRCYLIAFILFAAHISYAQKGIEKLSLSKIDSLRSEHIDTIVWYHSYCGECFFKKTDAPIKYRLCQVQSGYDLTYNVIIYKQNGKYFILNFDCTNLIIKRQLGTCKSIPYSISIIPTLNARDNTIKARNKKGNFTRPIQTDGGFEDAEIHLGNKVQNVHIQDDVDRDASKVASIDFWITKEIKLLELISSDISKKP